MLLSAKSFKVPIKLPFIKLGHFARDAGQLYRGLAVGRPFHIEHTMDHIKTQQQTACAEDKTEPEKRTSVAAANFEDRS